MKTYKLSYIEKESNLTIISESKKAILRAKKTFYHHRKILEKFVALNDEFLTSFSPVKTDSEYEVIQLMSEAGYICNVGPMAAVAGALADLMLAAMKYSDNIKQTPIVALVENGGEIAIDSEEPMKIALYAGENKLNFNLGFLIEKKDCPIGIATSSATIGHAISLGEADAVTIFAKNASLADAAATRIANEVKGEDLEKSIKDALDHVDDLADVYGAFISRGDKIGKTGRVPKLIKLSETPQKYSSDKDLIQKMNKKMIE